MLVAQTGIVELDFETKSYADLKKVGVWAYSEDPSTDVICLRYSINNGDIKEWWPGMECKSSHEMPVDLYMAVLLGMRMEAHNVAFELSIWANVMVLKYGWLPVALGRWDDTMAVANYYAMPPALDKLASALGYEGKDPEGTRLISKYSKLHLKTAKTEIPDEDFFKFVDYCGGDVKVEQSISDELGELPAREKPVFELDKIINMRGLLLDLDGIATATKIVDQRSAELTEKFRGITGLNPTQTAKLITWFAKKGLVLENMQKQAIEDLLEEDNNVDPDDPRERQITGEVREALELRMRINKASTKKLDAMSRQVGKDGRARFQSRYHGAVTGRWTGSGFQPLNLVRGYEDVHPDQLVRDIMHGDAKFLDMLYGDAMEAVSKASRHWIKAADGHKIIAGDFVSVEAIILACLAEEEWKIEAFKNKVKIYEFMADKIYNLPIGTVTKQTHPTERQDGKTGELAFGYGGALGAWLKFDSSGRHSDERIIEICKAWRAEHPATVAFWGKLEKAAIAAVREGGVHKANSIGFEVVDEWLTMILPNGKRLWYRDPQVRMVKPRWCKPAENEDCALGECDHPPVPQLSYMSQKEGRWMRVTTYGGKLAENSCQAVSREILVPAMLALEDAGYSIILNVYDEVVSEVPKDFGSTEEFEHIMSSSKPEFAKDWPISADAWEGERYKK
jgi:DNA polymerase bacteriophage-type